MGEFGAQQSTQDAKRERRLERNRVSARARRQRKKVSTDNCEMRVRTLEGAEAKVRG